MNNRPTGQVLKWLALLIGGASVFQATTCDSTVQSLSQDLVTTIVDQWITSYFNDQLNVAGGTGVNF